ncbi:unnamed protein product [Sphenostylis stenocarpa]|uniref:Uncharacterized protein n=1 Tax=Sphenostylis stenocarpa TaxID=92480 RepID=A0AA86RQ71_9FABA|nr:unnamed protein product [Sphenostylis stenocarpa]
MAFYRDHEDVCLRRKQLAQGENPKSIKRILIDRLPLPRNNPRLCLGKLELDAITGTIVEVTYMMRRPSSCFEGDVLHRSRIEVSQIKRKWKVVLKNEEGIQGWVFNDPRSRWTVDPNDVVVAFKVSGIRFSNHVGPTHSNYRPIERGVPSTGLTFWDYPTWIHSLISSLTAVMLNAVLKSV